jgi:hypothetical protein
MFLKASYLPMADLEELLLAIDRILEMLETSMEKSKHNGFSIFRFAFL